MAFGLMGGIVLALCGAVGVWFCIVLRWCSAMDDVIFYLDSTVDDVVL